MDIRLLPHLTHSKFAFTTPEHHWLKATGAIEFASYGKSDHRVNVGPDLAGTITANAAAVH